MGPISGRERRCKQWAVKSRESTSTGAMRWHRSDSAGHQDTILARLPLRRGSSIGSRTHVRTARSEEHTSELQSLRHLVCRLLLENDAATTEIYTLSLHDALPISGHQDTILARLPLRRGSSIGSRTHVRTA